MKKTEVTEKVQQNKFQNKRIRQSKIKLQCGVAVMIFAMGVLTGCGQKAGETPVVIPEQTGVTAEPLLSETESAIRDYELKYNNGEFTMEDYHALADLYRTQGLIRRQRDMLEQSYRLFDDTEAFDSLQNISVNLAEEDETVQEEAKQMLQNLQLADYLSDGINQICNDNWMDTMMPKLREGKRNYFLSQNGEILLAIQAGFTADGQPDTTVWYQGEEQVLVLKRTGDSVQFLRTGMKDGAYDGVFDSWNCDGNTGDIIHEQGTFQGGVMTGDYTAYVHTGSEAGDVYALWSNRETMEYRTYRGNFNEQGVTTLEQPTENNRKTFAASAQAADCVVYAYDESGENCLFMGLLEGEEASAYTFRAGLMGWGDYPVVDAYEVQETDGEKGTSDDSSGDGADGSQAADDGNTENSVPRVRIYDGEVQIYQGSAWVSLGTVQQYEREDPFKAYEDSRTDSANETAGESGEEGRETTENRRLSGTIQKETPKSDTQKKPSGNKNNSSNKNNNATPAPSPEPTQEPQEQAPAQQPAQPQPAQPQPSQPQPSQPETPSGGSSDNGGNDTEVGWGMDLLEEE